MTSNSWSITLGNKSLRPSTRENLGMKAAQRRFLACFGATLNATRSARMAKIDRQTHYRWMRDDPTYPARYREAQQHGIRALEDHAVKLEHEGVRRLVTYKGKPVKDPVTGGWLYETQCDTQLIMFLLKAYDPQRFGDKIHATFDANWSGNLEDLPEEFLRQVLQRIEAQVATMEAKQLEQAQTIDLKPEPLTPSGQS
jgi:hypothetical protein